MDFQRSYSDHGAHFDSSLGSTHSRTGHQAHLFIETPPTSPRDSYPLHSGDPAMHDPYHPYWQHPHRGVRQHRPDRAMEEPSRNTTHYHQQPNSPHISYTGAAQAGSLTYLYPQNGSLDPLCDMFVSPQIYQSSPAYSSAPRTSPHTPDATLTPYVNYAPVANYGQPTRAPYASGTASPDVSHLPHAAPTPLHRIMHPGHTHQPDLPRCEWDGCNQPMDDLTCPSVRRHLRDHHYKGNAPSAKDHVHCKWGGSCRREAMQWENIPKHIAECHTKTMTRTCDLCGDTFARSDTLKRHKEAGNCSRSNLR